MCICTPMCMCTCACMCKCVCVYVRQSQLASVGVLAGIDKRIGSGVQAKAVARPIPMDLLLWTVSSSCVTIPMVFLFLCYYSYGPMVYSHAILVVWAYSYGYIPVDLMAHSCGHLPFPVTQFLWTYGLYLCDCCPWGLLL